ncbi:MAG: FtsX-like permease family protein [Treponema sp.]|nr:FtsX-like permease family protein [Treponema sp.]
MWVPLETYLARLSSNQSLDSIAVSVKSKSLISLAERDLTLIMREAHGLSEKQSDNFSIMNSADILSVTERIREIGILMSIGASSADILLQFLSESSAISLSGGIIGIAFALLSCTALNSLGVPSSVNPFVVLLAAGFSVAVGLFFGWYPAKKAAELKPIEALRWE